MVNGPCSGASAEEPYVLCFCCAHTSYIYIYMSCFASPSWSVPDGQNEYYIGTVAWIRCDVGVIHVGALSLLLLNNLVIWVAGNNGHDNGVLW